MYWMQMKFGIFVDEIWWVFKDTMDYNITMNYYFSVWSSWFCKRAFFYARTFSDHHTWLTMARLIRFTTATTNTIKRTTMRVRVLTLKKKTFFSWHQNWFFVLFDISYNLVKSTINIEINLTWVHILGPCCVCILKAIEFMWNESLSFH